MNNSNQRIIDSHVHLDNIYRKNPDRINWMKERSLIPVSWSFAMNVENQEDLKDYLRTKANIIHNLSQEGLECYFLCGIHPRNITPDLSPGDVKDIISPFLDDPLCLGIGEIGLETGTQKEKEIFEAQLDIGRTLRNMGKKLGIHTPRDNKPEITREILTVLESFRGTEEITVIDHCIPETIGWVLEKGYWAGVTLSPIKASLQDLEQVVKRHPQDLKRIMCNTDSGTVFYEDVYQLYNSRAFSPDVLNRLVFENAFQFFVANKLPIV